MDTTKRWQYLFNYDMCAAEPFQVFGDYMSGSRVLFDDPETDVLLLELFENPPAAFHVYHAGWDATDRGVETLQDGTICIHHPRGDAKKISRDTDPPQPSCPWCDHRTNPSLAWIVGGWQLGTTEPGSSGSGLFSVPEARLLGVLTGGWASCPPESGADRFGSLYAAWRRGLGYALLGPEGYQEWHDAADGSAPAPRTKREDEDQESGATSSWDAGSTVVGTRGSGEQGDVDNDKDVWYVMKAGDGAYMHGAWSQGEGSSETDRHGTGTDGPDRKSVV